MIAIVTRLETRLRTRLQERWQERLGHGRDSYERLGENYARFEWRLLWFITRDQVGIWLRRRTGITRLQNDLTIWRELRKLEPYEIRAIPRYMAMHDVATLLLDALGKDRLVPAARAAVDRQDLRASFTVIKGDGEGGACAERNLTPI